MKGGAPIQAIMHVNGVTFKEALVVASGLCGKRTFDEMNTIKKSVVPQLSSDESKAKAQLSAQSIWQGTTPLANSLAEKYLKKHRGITEIGGLKDMRYWPVGAKWKKINEEGILVESVNKIPALVIAAKNSEQQISAVQRIYLDKNTENKNRFMLEAKRAKMSCGVIKGSAGIIQKGNANGRVYIAEGPETAASIAMADPRSTVLVSFGVNNIANLSEAISRLNPREVVIAADSDPKNDKGKSSKDTTEMAAKALRDAGISTTVIYPKLLEENKKTDWNDILMKDGVESVRKQLGLTKPVMDVKVIQDIDLNVNIKNTNYSLPDKNIIDLKNTRENSLSSLAKEYASYMEHNKTNNPVILNKQNIELRELNLSVPVFSDSKNTSKIKTPSKISEKTMIKEMEI